MNSIHPNDAPVNDFGPGGKIVVGPHELGDEAVGEFVAFARGARHASLRQLGEHARLTMIKELKLRHV